MIFVFSAICGGAAGSEDAKAPATEKKHADVAETENSRMVLELRLRALYEDLGKKSQVHDRLKEIAKALAASRKKLDDNRSPDLATSVQIVSDAYLRLNQAWTRKNPDEISQAVIQFGQAFRGAIFNATRPATDAVQDVYALANPLRGPNDSQPLPKLSDNITRLAMDLYGRNSSPEWNDAWRTQVPSIFLIFQASPFGNYRGSSQEFKLEPSNLPDGANPLPIAKAKEELDTRFANVLAQVTQQSTAEKYQTLTNLEKSVADEQKAMSDEIVRVRTEAEAIDKKLKAREDLQSGIANQVSGNLQPIFWGMMIAIIATIAVLRIRGDDQSLLMIRERTAVEMLSIGMFLVTVLFLGAGGFIEKATLGTLLGTLAGYLFTRRPAANHTATAVDNQSSTQPESPAAPAFDSVRKVLVVPNSPKGVDYLTLSARDVESGSQTFLGVVSGTTFDFSTSNLPKGKFYEIRLVAHSLAGASAPGKPVIVKI